MCLTLQHLHGNVTKWGHHEGQVFRDRTVPPGVNRPLGLLGLQLSAFFKAPPGPVRLRCLSKRAEFLRIHPLRTVPSCCSQAAMSHTAWNTEQRTGYSGHVFSARFTLSLLVRPLTPGSRGSNYGALLGHARGRKYVAGFSAPLCLGWWPSAAAATQHTLCSVPAFLLIRAPPLQLHPLWVRNRSQYSE